MRIPRSALYALLAESTLVVSVTPLLVRAHARRRREAAAGLAGHAARGLGAEINNPDAELVCR